MKGLDSRIFIIKSLIYYTFEGSTLSSSESSIQLLLIEELSRAIPFEFIFTEMSSSFPSFLMGIGIGRLTLSDSDSDFGAWTGTDTGSGEENSPLALENGLSINSYNTKQYNVPVL